ncbi:DegV family protein [Streptococcus hillyeri]|uniref:DegV family protein n=1 Tax=Streptococcus hillyeri TaxID=2282420 RepID=A0A3L9DWA6_9STRE|nr:DegV family protein [Streptococcus hillyeri]RLY04147.1 DegV family protein [Streptococcus hillyeri]
MKLAVITDSSVFFPEQFKKADNLFILDIPVTIDGDTYVEGVNLTATEFYEKMAAAQNLPMTSQPSVAQLDELLFKLANENYTHVVGLFLSSGISGFWANIQYLIEEHEGLTIAFPDTKITSAPLGMMVMNALNWAEAGLSFETIMDRLHQQIEKTSAYIMVDDLNHLVKGGRLSNSSAILGNLLSIKPILYFDETGKIVVYEKVRTEKKAVKRLIDVMVKLSEDGSYDVMIIHGNAVEKANSLYEQLTTDGVTNLSIATFGSVIGTHLGEGAIALGVTPHFD